MKKTFVAAALAVAALVAGPAASAGASDIGIDASGLHVQPVAKSGVYIVVMKGDPAVAYTGGIAGLRATKPAPGRKLDRRNVDVRKYAAHLEGEQNKALAAVGVPRAAKLTSYRFAANGFSAKLTTEQADALRALPSVRLVTADVRRTIQDDVKPARPSSTSAAFLSLNGKGGVYASGVRGEGVVVGVVDTGIWPEHPSLSPVGFGPRPATFSGSGCDFGNGGYNPADAAFTCNNKLLAAKAYSSGFLEGIGEGLAAGSYMSARDEDGHGTHTATTAAGNSRVQASILGSNFGNVTGIAPRARISVYKACWTSESGIGACFESDTAAAIDDAVADGVDVINFSIGGSAPVFGLDDLSFLFAADAGVFVSRSAGNEGPEPGTVGTSAVSAWVTAVGASTTDSTFESTVTLGNGTVLRGASVTGGVGPKALVDAGALGNPLCLGGVPFSAPITDKIVLCKRGSNARIEKSEAVAAAGGAGMVLYNAVAPQATVTDNHFVPSIHLTNPDGQAVLAYIAAAGAGATATLASASRALAQGSVMADFSSRGPNGFTEDIITPDVTAPGVNILAGNTPTPLDGPPGQFFQAISGTSMSAPHVAGIYALVKQAHPEWSSAAAKSALMTTARQNVTKEDGVTPADPFDMGAGHVAPGGEYDRKGSLFNPGAVYDADIIDYLGSTCESFPLLPTLFFGDSACDDLAAFGVQTAAENLNQASIAVGDVTGTATITRTLTNVSGRKLSLEAKVQAPAGFTAKVSPRELKLGVGKSASFTVTFTRTTAPFGAWGFGQLVWSGNDFRLRSPIALKAKEFSAPGAVSGIGATGAIDLPVKFGYAGSYTATGLGAVSAHTVAWTVDDDPANDLLTAIDTGVGYSLEIVEVPANAVVTRIALRNADVVPGADLDLYVFNDAFDQVGASAAGGSHETVDLYGLAPGVYYVLIHGYDTVEASSPYVLYDWTVTTADTGGSVSVTSAPAAAVLAGSGTVGIAWAGADPSQEQIGAIWHTGPLGTVGATLVELNVRD
ncbi:MAG: S8 family serine peptidase [Acidobacteria bacterium]|nr:S8 family serine peptidase [Acidobacteriota bacterium]